MEKPTVSPTTFVEIVNARLHCHPLYREGMKVYAIPRHSEQPRSLVCVGPRGTESVCATVEAIVRGECEVVPDIPQDWHQETTPSAFGPHRPR